MRGRFDERAYLDANPDVRAAVEDGALPSGRAHWDAFGQAERRPLRAKQRRLTRREKLLEGIDVATASGVEIGPLTAPIVRKRDGDVLYIDHADTETLRRKYAGTHVDTDAICPVDAVWGQDRLADCLGGRTVDYVVNAHVVEHVPDLVTWLAEIRAILKPGGRLRMAVPDRRYTFDILRRESTLAQALDAYLRRARAPLPLAILDHFLHYVDVDGKRVWRGEVSAADLRPLHEPGFALELARRFHGGADYQDTHCWVFTPASFVELCGQLAGLDLLDFACERIRPTEFGDNEFTAALRIAADGDDARRSWDEAARALAAAG